MASRVNPGNMATTSVTANNGGVAAANASKKRKTTPPTGGDELDQSSKPSILESDDGGSNNNNKRVRQQQGMISTLPLVPILGAPVSSTSATSSSSLPPTNNSGTNLDTKLQELEEDVRLIKNWEHVELGEKVKQLEKRKGEDLQKASLLRELRLKEVELLYEFQVQEANDVFAAKRKEAQERMIFDCEESMKRMKDLRDGTVKKRTTGRGRSGSIGAADDDESQEEEETTAAANASNPQGDESEEGVSVQQVVAQKKSARGGSISMDKKALGATNNSTEQSNIYAAPADLIAQDLAMIHADWMKRVEIYHTKEELANLAVRVDDGRLYFNEYIIEKGNNVVVHSEATKDELFGTISKITPSEITLRLGDGNSSRLLVSQLRAGRCRIAKDSTKDTAVAAQ